MSFFKKKKKSSFDILEEDRKNEEALLEKFFNDHEEEIQEIFSFLEFTEQKEINYSCIAPASGNKSNHYSLYDKGIDKYEIPEILRKYYNKGIHCIYLNPREKNKTKKEDVKSLKTIVIDIDVKKEHKVNFVSPENLKDKTINISKNIERYLESKGFRLGMRVDSGNGCHLFYKVDINVSNSNSYDKTQTILRNLVNELSEKFDCEHVEIDKQVTVDINRKIKLPSTLNLKNTQQSEIRKSKIINFASTWSIHSETNNKALYKHYENLNNKNISSNKERNPKEVKKNKENLHFLLTNKIETHDISYGINDNKLYYSLYGKKEKRGKHDFIKTVLVSDEKKLYVTDESNNTNEISEIFKLNYSTNFNSDIVKTWSNESVENWINGYKKSKSPKEIFNLVKNRIKEYIYIEDEHIYNYLAADIITTYFPFFESKGRTIIYAPPASGKTKLLTIYKLLSFNAFLLEKETSEAAILRIIKCTNGTILKDNLDRGEDGINKIINMIDVGYKDGVDAVKCTGKDYEDLTLFKTKCHLVIGNIEGIQDKTARTRCNFIAMKKTDDSNILNKKIEIRDQEWQDLKDEIYIFAMENWKYLETYYNEIRDIGKLKGRDLENIEANCSFLKFVDKDLYENFIDFYEKYYKEFKTQYLDNDWVYLSLNYLVNELNRVTSKKVSVIEIFNSLVNDGKLSSEQKLSFTKSLGTQFNNARIFDKSKNSSGNAQYLFTKDTLITFIRNNNLEEEFNDFCNNTESTEVEENFSIDDIEETEI